MSGGQAAFAGAQDQAALAQSLREAARTQQIMAGRIADELREVYRNLDLRPQIIPVPMPQIVVPQASGAWGARVPPGLQIAGIPRYAREEELPLEPAAEQSAAEQPAAEQPSEENWDEAFAALEPFPEESAGPSGAPVDRRVGLPDRRVGPPTRREGPAERRQGPPDRREESAERRQLKDYLARVRERLERPQAAGASAKADIPVGLRPAGRGKRPKKARPAAAALAPAAEAKPAGEQKPAGPPVERPPPIPSAEGPLALLEELGEYLPKREPERRKGNAFMRSDARMKLDYLKSRLEGHKGIMHKIQEDFAPGASEGPVTLQKVADAFIFIKDLARYYPDPSVGTMMQSKVDSILRRIKR
jgi:hypothetical protein